MKSFVKDLIIDMRTFNYYHEHGVAPGTILLAPMCKTNPSNFPIELKKASQKYLGFRDPFYKTMQTIYYAIPYSKPIADIVFASKDNKNFVVLAKWRTIQTETNDRVFFADTVSKKMILPLNDSDSVLTISHFKSDLVSD